MKTYLVIDVGGTNIKYALMKEDLSFVDKGEIETPKTNLDDFVNALVLLYEARKDQVDGMAFSLPGLIDSTKGFMYTGGALSHYLFNVNLVEMMQARTGVPVTIENDGKCAALAELWKGSLKGVDIGMVLTVGTGIGGGLVVGGKWYVALISQLVKSQAYRSPFNPSKIRLDSGRRSTGHPHY